MTDTYTLIDGKAPTEFNSSDRDIVVSLMALGFQPVRIVSDRAYKLTITFDQAEVKDTVSKLLLNVPITVELSKVFMAEKTWNMNLSNARQIVNGKN